MRFEIPYLNTIRSSYDVIAKWNHLLLNIQSKDLKITKEVIDECEREMMQSKRLKRHELAQFVKNAKHFYKTIDGMIESGINSFSDQRNLALICKKADYVMK